MTDMIITLQPHHAVCLRLYEGSGYSDEFCREMAAIKKRLEDGAACVFADSAADDVCRCCPHNRAGKCDERDKVAAINHNLAAYTALTYGRRYNWRQVVNMTQGVLNNSEKLAEICAGCEWLSLCRQICERRREKDEH